MKTRLSRLVAVLMLSLFIYPLPGQAAWFFKRPLAAPADNTATLLELPPLDQTSALIKRERWREIFDRCQPESLAVNNTPLIFSPAEIVYLFNSESETVKSPILKNLDLSLNGDKLLIAADWQRFLKGRISFSAQAVKNNDRLNLAISQAKFGRLPLPAALVAHPLNKALDQYFDCLYRYDAYRSADLEIKDGLLIFSVDWKN